MLNPLSRHKSTRPNDATSGGASDLEGSASADIPGYIGRIKALFFFLFLSLFVCAQSGQSLG